MSSDPLQSRLQSQLLLCQKPPESPDPAQTDLFPLLLPPALSPLGCLGFIFDVFVKFFSTDYLESHSEAPQSSHQRSLQLQSPLLLLLYPFQFSRVYQMIEEGLARFNIRSACLPPLPPVPLLLPSMVGFIPALTAKPAPVSNSVW